MKQKREVIIFAVMFLFLSVTSVFAQVGVSSSSVSRSKPTESQEKNRVGTSSGSVSYTRDAVENNYNQPSYQPNYQPSYQPNYQPANNYFANLLKSNEIHVEEFINYHKHQLPLPKAGQAIAMDVRWGGEQIALTNSQGVLQIGLSTSFTNDRQNLPPVNLSIVIDRSGSMADDAKLEKVKSALITLVNQLKNGDVLSLVTYDTNAQVLWPAQYLTGNRHTLINAISSIQPNGSTNLHAGLMLGYQEAVKYYRKDATNRVVLLTDGIANAGVTSTNQIARESQRFNDRGVDLSTIGVGRDLNEDLLRQLANSGRGLYHFVADAQDVEKIFVKEVSSLVAAVARRVRLHVEYDPALQLNHLYGYQPNHQHDSFSIMLDNLNLGATQVVMMQFGLKRANREITNRRLPVRVTLYYDDIAQKRSISESEQAFIQVTETSNVNALMDEEVKKNFTIACLSQALKDMVAAYELHNRQLASHIANSTINQVYSSYPTMSDKDISYILNIIQDYQEKLGLGNVERNTSYGGR